MIIGLMQGTQDIEIVSAPQGPKAMITRLGARDIDVVIVRAADVDDCSALLTHVADAAPIGVVSVNDEGNGGTSYRVLREDVVFSEAGGQQLISAIHMAAGRS